MPQEPDRKIEELLKAYAKKRREGAGAPLELHPATRKLLQAEAARLRPKPAAGSASWFQLLMQFWPRVGFAISIVVAVGLLFWVFDSRKERATQFAQAPSKAAQESADKDYLSEKDVTLKREALDSLSALKPDAKVDRPQQPLDEAEAILRSQEPAVAGNADRRKDFDGESKLKAPAAKAGSQVAQRDDKGRIDPYAAQTPPASSVAPSTPGQAPVSGGIVAPAIQSVEIAPKPAGVVQAGGDFGGAVQNQPAENVKNNVRPMQESKAAARLGVLLSPATTNSILAFSVNGPFAVDSSGTSAFQKTPASTTNAVGYYYNGFQSSLLTGISTNSTNSILFADNGVSRFYQNKLVGDDSTKESERLREAGVGGGAITASPGKATQDLKQLPEVAKATAAGFGVNKDLDDLAQQSRSFERQPTTWKFVAEEQSARNESELAELRLRSEADERLRRSRTAGKPAVGAEAVAPPLLTSFQVDLNGDRIRLTDADGSVYEGNVATNKDEWRRKTANVRSDAEAPRTLEDLEKKQSASEGAKAPSNPEPVSFRASGINRTLKQPVVIDATLSSTTVAPGESFSRGASAPFSETARNTQAPPASAPAPVTRLAPADGASTAAVRRSDPMLAGRRVALPASMRIQGKARIGATNEVSINALRVAP